MRHTTAGIPLIIVVLVSALLGAGNAVQAADQDKGNITKMGDMRLEVEGNLGVHVFEIARDCTWCEIGTDVVIEFLGFGRARIKPASQTIRRVSPLIGVVVVDGREGGEKIPEKKKEQQ